MKFGEDATAPTAPTREGYEYVVDNGYELDFSTRHQHEIYISDPRKIGLNKLKTIIRHPVKIKNQFNTIIYDVFIESMKYI